MQFGEHFPQKFVKKKKHRRLTNHSNSDKPGATCSVEFIHSKLLQLKYLLLTSGGSRGWGWWAQAPSPPYDLAPALLSPDFFISVLIYYYSEK